MKNGVMKTTHIPTTKHVYTYYECERNNCHFKCVTLICFQITVKNDLEAY